MIVFIFQKRSNSTNDLQKLIEDFQQNESNAWSNFEAIQSLMKVSSSESLTSLVKVENAKQATLEARKTLEAVKTNAANVQSLGLKVNKSMSSKGQAVVQGSIKQLQNAVDNMEAEMSRQSTKVCELRLFQKFQSKIN